MDHLIHFPPNFKYINQFAASRVAPDPSKYRCVAATIAMLAQVAYPNRWNPEELEHDFYVQYAGPDTATDTNGISKEAVLEWLTKNHVGYIDLQHLVGDPEELRKEITAMNAQNVPQLLTIADESHLKFANGTDNRPKLHNWADTGLAHCFARVGYSDDHGYGLYLEPAAPGWHQPVPILWSDITDGQILTCIAIMPSGVPVPPAGFSFQHGTWPVPPAPPVDHGSIADDLKAENTTLEQVIAALHDVPNQTFVGLPGYLENVVHTLASVQASNTRIAASLTSK